MREGERGREGLRERERELGKCGRSKCERVKKRESEGRREGEGRIEGERERTGQVWQE